MRRALAFVLVFVLLAALTGGLSYFQFVMKPAMIKAFISKAPHPPATVAVVEAKSELWPTQIHSIGTFTAVRSVNIASQVAGVISALHFVSGKYVAKGQPLINLDDSVEEADLQSNQAAFKNAELALVRQNKLLPGGSIAQSTLDQAQAARDQAASAVQKSQALIAQKALSAPFAGRLGLRTVSVGQYVSPGATLVTLQQLDPIFVDFPVPEQSFSLLKVGERVNVAVDAYPHQAFSGKLSAIDALVSADTRSIMVRAEIKNDKMQLRPGMFANVTVFAGKPRHLVTLPQTAIAYSLYGDSAYVVKPAPAPAGAAAAQAATPSNQTFKVEARTVRVGDTRKNQVAILSGLSPGDRVVSEGQIKLLPGALVKIDNKSALPSALKPLPKE